MCPTLSSASLSPVLLSEPLFFCAIFEVELIEVWAYGKITLVLYFYLTAIAEDLHEIISDRCSILSATQFLNQSKCLKYNIRHTVSLTAQ